MVGAAEIVEQLLVIWNVCVLLSDIRAQRFRIATDIER